MSSERPLDACRSAILENWRRLIFATYPGEAPKTLKRSKAPFMNPIGEIIRSGTEEVLEGFFGSADREALSSSLEGIVRMRAVQEFTPARAVSFVFGIKDAVREEAWKNEMPMPPGHEEMRVDDLALLAFELYVACREKVFDLRAKMMRDRSYKLMQRAGMLWEEPAGGADAAEPDGA